MIEKPYDPKRRLTFEERGRKRTSLMQEVDDYIQEMILYCDDEEDLIAMGSLLQICSKNILTTVMDRKDWKSAIHTYIDAVEKETDYGSVRRMYKDYF